MINVSIYIQAIEGGIFERLDLFADENISVNSSIQNINDISKTFTDFSQTFTIPASKQNNKIFKHWYENSNDNGFSTLIKADAYIELDTMPFRTGKIQLESCNIKNGKSQDYSITFIGALGSLKDTFNGLLLKDLNTGEYDFPYSESVVRTKTTTQTSDDIKFPLISSLRLWTYAEISTLTNRINYTELFPALRLRKVLKLIENKFKINFIGTFIDSDPRFLNAYLYLKNAEIFKPRSSLVKFDYSSQTSGTTIGTSYNLTTDVFNLTTINKSFTNCERSISFSITNTTNGDKFYVYCYKNGIQLSKTLHYTTIGAQAVGGITIYGTEDDLSNYEFYFNADDIVYVYSSAMIKTTYYDGGIYYSDESYLERGGSPQITLSLLSVAAYMPEQKIEDFFSGVLKMFNLTCYSVDSINYQIKPLETYYADGTIINITKHIKSDNTNINRSKTFNKVYFQFEKSQNLLSTEFLTNNRVEYGNLLADFNSDGSTYDVKLPFENILFTSLASNLIAGFAVKSDLKAYIPKPIILYDYGVLQNIPTTYITSYPTTTYNAFGNETSVGGVIYSLNFGQEQSPLTNELINNSLYSEYYQSYLTNIFDFKARLIKVSAILQISLLTSLKLNDRLIIRDKRYLINTMTTDLTTGEVQFELLTDNRIL